MLIEVVSTLTPKGLFAGSSGFCPVAVTDGMPRDLIQTLADIAKRQFETNFSTDPSSRHAYYHFPLVLSNQVRHLIGRASWTNVSGNERDRQCVIHQLLIDNVKSVPAGPAWLLVHEAGWIDEWRTEPQYLALREIESPMVSPRICQTWSRLTGDAGWAGAALDAWHRSKAFTVIVPPTLDSPLVLDLFVEAQSLLEPRIRWNIPLSIFAWSPAKLRQKMWSASPSGSRQSLEQARNPANVVVDMSRPLEPSANAFGEIARAGAWARLEQPKSKMASLQSSPRSATATAQEFFVGVEDPLLSPLPTASASVHRPLSAAYQPKKPNALRQIRSIPWFMLALSSALFGLVALGIWKGPQLFGRLTAAVNQLTAAATATGTSSSPPIEKSTVRESIAVNSPADEEDVAHAVVARNASLPIESHLSAAECQALLVQVRNQKQYIDLPDRETKTPICLLTFPAAKSAAASFGAGLATPRRFIELTDKSRFDPASDVYSVDLVDALGNNASAIGFQVQQQPNESAHQTDLMWTWQSTPSADLVSEINSGAFLLWPHDDPTAYSTIPLEGPTRGPAFNLLKGLVEGIEFSPQANPTAIGILKWSARVTGFAGRTENSPVESQTGLWLAPRSDGNPSNHFVLNAKPFESLLMGDLKDQAAAIDPHESIARLMERISPVEVEIRLEDPIPVDGSSGKQRATIRTIVFMRGADGGPNSIILQFTADSGKKPSLKDVEKKIKTDFANWLVNNLELPLSGQQVAGDGFQQYLKPLKGWEERLKARFAQQLFVVVSKLLERDYQFEAIRATTLCVKSGNVTVDILAYVGR